MSKIKFGILIGVFSLTNFLGAAESTIQKSYFVDKFINSDGKNYADRDLDDTNWESNLRVGNWFDDPRFKNYEGVGWYRFYYVLTKEELQYDHSVILPVQYAPSEVFVNGKLIGKTQNEKNFHLTKLGKNMFFDISKNLLVEGKNVVSVRTQSHDGWGGFRDVIVYLGEKDEIHRTWIRRLIWYTGMVFIFLFLSIYFSIYYSRKSDSSFYLYFSLMSLMLGLWIFTYNGYMFYFLNNYAADIVGTYLSGILFMPMMTGFLHSFFDFRKKLPIKIFDSVFYFVGCVLLFEYIVTGQIHFFNRHVFNLFMPLLLLGVIYAIGLNITAILSKKNMAKRTFLGLIALGVSLTFLVFSQLGLYFGDYYLPEGYFMMVTVFASVLATRYNQINVELLDAHEDLKELDKMKDSFLAATSHELKTPITGIIGLSETMLISKREPLTYRQEEVLRLIQHSGKRLSQLVNDLLDAAQLKQKKIILKPDVVDIGAVVNRVFMICEPLLTGKQLKLENKIDKKIPMLFVDEDRIEQILINLINNSIKFSTSGKIEVTATHDEHSGRVNIAVRDYGIGIPEDQFDLIFEPLHQVNGGDSRKYGGTGLGLAISKSLVELHGGRITVESSEEKGTAFQFDLPVSDKKRSGRRNRAGMEELEKGKKRAEKGSKGKKKAVKKKNKLVLVADDDMVNVRILSDALQDLGYEVISCHTSKQVYDIIFIEEIIPDLILLDIMMPGKTGYELTSIIREKYPIDLLPIVLITAKTQKEDMELGFHSGANDYITKPFLMAEVLNRVENQFMLKDAYSTKNKLEDFTTEIQLSKKLHRSVIPAGNPPIDNIDIIVKQKSKYEISGDYYDFLSLDKKHFGFLLCDVSTNGVSATVISAMIKVAFIQMESLFDSPTHLVTQMNYLLSDYLSQFFITLSYTYFDMANYQVKFASAGHTSLILYRQKEKRCLEFDAEGNALGVNPNLQIETKTFSVAKGDKVILYSDGVIGAKDINGELFSEEMVMDIIRRNPEKNNAGLSSEIINAVKRWTVDGEFPQEDITVAIFDIE